MCSGYFIPGECIKRHFFRFWQVLGIWCNVFSVSTDSVWDIGAELLSSSFNRFETLVVTCLSVDVSRETYWVKYLQTPVSVRRRRCLMKSINKLLTYCSLSRRRVADRRLPVLCLWKSWPLPFMTAPFTAKLRWEFLTLNQIRFLLIVKLA